MGPITFIQSPLTDPCGSGMVFSRYDCRSFGYPFIHLSPSEAIWPPVGAQSCFSSVMVGFGATAPQQSNNPSADLLLGLSCWQ